MENRAWQELFKSIRADDQPYLTMVMLSGLEVAVQQIARVEEDLVMVRGRIAGQVESGRLFLLPYSNIAALFVNRQVILEEVELFSPAVTPEHKEEVAKRVAGVAAKAKQEAEKAGKPIKDKEVVTVDLKRQLEQLREEHFGPGEVAAAKVESKPVVTSAPALPGPKAPGLPARPALPPKPTMPKKPKPPGSE